MLRMVRLSLCCAYFFCFAASAAALEKSDERSRQKSGLEKRIPWTTSRVAGTPDPPLPYVVEPAFPHLKFERPVLLTSAPGTSRMFVAEQAGKIYSFENDPDCQKTELVADLKKTHPDLTAIYGLTFHPDFADNQFVYVCYVLKQQQADGTCVARFKLKSTNPPRIDPESEQILIRWFAGGHNGGCLKFGPDGFLYISSGDASGPSPPDTFGAGQDVSNLLSSVLRIDVDQSEGGKAYRIPADNPLVKIKNARPEVWAYGFRNPWKMSFDRSSGDLWVGDVGWEQWEMVYRIKKGGNYGWSIMEGRQQVHPEGKRGPTPILPPTMDHPHSEAASITGGFVYHGRRLKALNKHYIYGDYQSGIVWSLLYDRENEKVKFHQKLANTPLQLVGFGEDNTGKLYLLDHNRTGQIYRLAENPDQGTPQNFPTRLSETGLFASVSNQQPASGVIPYSINAHHWADHTVSQRWLAVPSEQQIDLDKKGNWLFPNGSVLVKTVSIEMEQNVPGSLKRLETQILHRENESWRPYTYIWNDAQTDGELADANGLSRTLKIRDPHAPEGIREQTYRFAGRAECMQCHNPWVEKKTTIFGVQSASPLAVQAIQLNRDHDYGHLTANQIHTFQNIGLISSQVAKAAENSPKFTDPYDESAGLNERVRSYLHVNCAHCHQFNAGGTATILLDYKVKLADAKMIDLRPTQGTFGISDARILSPGDPFGSILYYRLSKLGGGRMPRVGSREVDEKAVKMIHEWISQIPRTGSPTQLSSEQSAAIETIGKTQSPEKRADAINQLTGSSRGALALLHLKSGRDLPRTAHQQIVSLTKNHARSEVRDLFERFVPQSERIKRLGSVINQSEILSLEADARRGKELFFSDSAAACKNCHRVKEQGKVLGPDLTQIGKKYRRDALLRHILQPSLLMEPKYVPYLLETAKGRIYTGLLTEKTDSHVVMKDAQDKEIRVKTADVELLVPQQKSLMPELLLKDMTRQQVADLLAYLSSLK